MKRRPEPGRGSILAIVGDTVHHLDQEGRLCTHGALASQLDVWARHFDQVRFCGVLVAGPPPPGFAPYLSSNIELVELSQAGGSGLVAKIGVLRSSAAWLRAMAPVLRSADAVHLRTPCNATILGILASRLLVRHRYAIYAGSWPRYRSEPLTYRLQRALLRRCFGGTVHVYQPPGERPDHPKLRPAFSPVLSAAQLTEIADEASRARARVPPPSTGRPLRVVCVGRFSVNKNQIALVEALWKLRRSGTLVECRFIGDGSEAHAVKAAAVGLGAVTFASHAGRGEIFEAMTWADVNVLPSFREGYPKVLLEGMSAGALPIASDTPMNRSMAEGCGWVFDPSEPDDLGRLLQAAIGLSAREWQTCRSACTAYAHRHTLDSFSTEVDRIVFDIWKVARAGTPSESTSPPSGNHMTVHEKPITSCRS